MRRSFLLSLVVLSACATTGAPSGSQPERETVRVSGAGGGTLTLTSNALASVKTLPFAVDKVWAVLPTAYDSLGIQVSTLLPNDRTIGNEGFKTRQRLGKTSLSRYLSCGDTQMGPSADTYEVTLSIVTKAKPDPEAPTAATTLETTVEATARPLNFSQTPSRCSSRGELEARIAQVALKLAAAR